MNIPQQLGRDRPCLITRKGVILCKSEKAGASARQLLTKVAKYYPFTLVTNVTAIGVCAQRSQGEDEVGVV
ncbi:hypothetical protein HaLaN_23414, partial [Haematococcus lacustris]